MSRTIYAMLLLMVLTYPLHLSAWGEKKVTMQARGPSCGAEVVYRRTYEDGKYSETYSVHAQKLEVNGIPAYQSISIYKDRVRRTTMRQSDLTPIHVSEDWDSGNKLIRRVYFEDKVNALRRNVEMPINETVEVPKGVHDPETFAFLLKGFPFEDQDSIAPIDVLVAEPNPIFTKPRTFGVYIIPKGEQKITVPAGTFDCYVLEMTLAGILGYIVPDNKFWLLKADPHLIVRVEGGGELVELVDGPFTCDGKEYCTKSAKAPELKP